MRQSLAVLAAGAAVLSLLTPGRTANGRAADLVIKKFAVKPGTVPGDGAEANVSVQFGPGGPRIARVLVAGYVPGSGWGPVTAMDGSGTAFQGVCKMPVNHSRVQMTGTVSLQITVAGGGSPVQRSTTVRVQPWTSDVYPPPPPSK